MTDYLELGVTMFRFRCKCISFSILLLTATLSGFCAGSILESAEAEAAGSEIEEVILSRRDGEGLTKSAIFYVSTRLCHKSVLRSLRLTDHPGSEKSARNGIGAPLTL